MAHPTDILQALG